MILFNICPCQLLGKPNTTNIEKQLTLASLFIVHALTQTHTLNLITIPNIVFSPLQICLVLNEIPPPKVSQHPLSLSLMLTQRIKHVLKHVLKQKE